MNKTLRFSLLSLLALLCSTVFAQPYSVDFNTAITTSKHDFKVASNWKHIVHKYNDGYSDYYMSYTYGAETGREGSGALYAGQQRAGDNYDYETTYDLLVTPVVSGEITIYAKKSSYGSGPFVQFWSLNDDATAYNEQLYAVTELSNDDWTAVTYTVETPQRIGIRAQYVYLDDFSAENAVIEPEKAIVIASAEPSATTGTIYWNQQANGKVLIKYTVTVTNTGDVDLTQGTDGFSVSIFNRTTGDVYGTTAVPQDLAKGETSEPFDVTAEVEPTVWPYSSSYYNMDLKENLQGSVLQRAWSRYNAYESKFVFRAAESTATSSISTAENWGNITESTTKSYAIANTGAAPLTIKSITLPEGFTSDNAPEIPAEGLVLNGGETIALNITQDATAYGAFAGNLVVEYVSYGSEEATTYTLAFSANYINPNWWTADFNNTTSSPAYPVGSIKEGGITTDWDNKTTDGKYNIYLKGYNTTSYQTENNKFITPKLHANAGDKLTFDVKAGYSSSDAYFVKVYVSTDRQTWGEPVETYVSSNVGNSFTSKNISFAEAGDYYVAFAIYGSSSAIDNLVGLERVDVAHDLYIKSVSWPDASVKSGTSLSKPSIDIIPLTDETADAYTVKYVCGETVLAEATPVALTASASSSKSFSFSWTPAAENTTTYENTKVVFEFTSGEKFETETFDLTVTNEAIFHFLNSVPTSKWYEPTDRTQPITFGKTNSADTQSFVIYNWGSAPLTVNSIALPEGFTTTTEFPMTVAAFDENNLSASAQTLDIVFSAAEAGTFSGDMVITYSTDKTFTLAISGTKLDPAKFYANFGTGDEAAWPAGSVYQSNISGSNQGNWSAADYYITSSSTTNNLFVTPKLTAAAGDKLAFDAKLYSAYWSEGKVVVYAAATRDELVNFDPEADTRTPLLTVSGTSEDEALKLTTDYKTFEVPFAEAGDYYVAFEISNRPYVDEIYGLKTAAVAHDWMIASSNIPAEAMQNVAATATVNILNLGIADEAADAYTATLYINGEAAATAETVALPMTHQLSAAGTQLSFAMQSPKAGTFPVYIEVKAGDYSLKTEAVDVVFAEEVAVANAIEVGTKSGSDRYHAIVNFYDMDGGAKTSDIVYTADQLNAYGITAGAKITSLAWKGTISSAKTMNNSLTAWVGMKTGDITPNSPDKESMTEVVMFDGTIPLTAGVNLFTINLTNPIIYDGTSDLRVYFEGTKGSWATVTFDYDTNYMNMYWSGNSTALANPLLYVTLAVEPATFAGTVKNAEGEAVEGAAITLVSTDGDNVQYAGVTDSEGAYSINVIQATREYEVTVTAEGYVPTVETIAFAGENIVKDFTVDVPLLAKYFVNTDFASTEGWNAVRSGSYNEIGNGKIGEFKVYNNIAATVDESHPATDYCFGFEVRWQTNYSSYTQESKTELPSGTYTLTFDVENVNGATTKAAYENRFTVTVGDKVFTDQATEWMNGKSSWTKHTLVFSVEEATKATLSFGYGTGSNNIGSTNTPIVYVSNLDMTFKSLIDAALQALEAEIAAAEALKTEARTAGLNEFNAAIATAQGFLTSTDAAAINAAVDNLKAAEETFLVANLPVEADTYYVYNPLTKKFLSIGNAYSTAAVVDDYGVPVKVSVANLANATYNLGSLFHGNSYGFDEWMYADASGNNVRSYTFTAVEGGYTITNTNNGKLMYVYLKEDGSKYRVAGNAIKDDNYTDDAQTVWQFINKEDHDAIVAANKAAAKTAAFIAANIAENVELAVAEPTVMNFGSNHGWTVNVVKTEKNQPANEGTVTEMWQATGTFTRTVTDLPEGLYKMSIQAFYRCGNNTDDQERVATGYNTVLAHLDANGFKGQVKSWSSDKGEGNDPNSKTQAQAMFEAGKYLTEFYTYVGEDGNLNLTISNPAYIGNGWFIVGNVKYAKVTKSTSTGITAVGHAAEDGQVFNLQGRKMQGTLKKGIYIVNDKKTVVK